MKNRFSSSMKNGDSSLYVQKAIICYQNTLYALYSKIFHVFLYGGITIIYGHKMAVWALYAVTAAYMK